MTEKRIFIPKRELNDAEKENQKKHFISEIKRLHKININPNELIETDDGNKWTVMFCDGVHIYSLSRYRNGNKSAKDPMYTADERKALKKFFLRFTSAILSKQLAEENLLEDEDETKYVLSYREEGQELLTFEYKKKVIGFNN